MAGAEDDDWIPTGNIPFEAMELPPCPVPSGRPKTQGMTPIDAKKVVAICRLVEKFTPIGAACGRHGVSKNSLTNWRAAAEDDPFYAWACNCLELAESSAIADATSIIHTLAHEGTKEEAVRLKAASFFLAHRSQEFQPVQKVEHSGQVMVQHDIVISRVDRMLSGGQVSIQQLMERTSMQQIPERQIIEGVMVDEPPKVMAVPEGALRRRVKRKKED